MERDYWEQCISKEFRSVPESQEAWWALVVQEWCNQVLQVPENIHEQVHILLDLDAAIPKSTTVWAKHAQQDRVLQQWKGSQRRQTVICSIYHRQTHTLILLTGLIVLKLICIQSQMDTRVFLCCNSTKKNCNSQHSCGRSIHLTKKKLQFLRFLWSIYLSHTEKTAILEILVVDLSVSERKNCNSRDSLVSYPSRRMGFV